MELNQVRYFLALAETLNFTKAAERCGVSQPTMSRAIKLLEEEFGADLIRRERGHTHLTELGRIVRPGLEQALAMMESVQTDAVAFSTDISQVACRLTSRSPDFARWASVFRPERCLSSRKRPKSGGSSLEPAAFWPGRAAFPRGRRTCPAAFVQLGHGSWSCA